METDVAQLSLNSSPNVPQFPPEIVHLICEQLYYLLLPPKQLHSNPDPYLRLSDTLINGKPLFAPTPAEAVCSVFRNLALVDRTWGHEAQRWLWHTVGFGMPRGFSSLLHTVEEYRSGQVFKQIDINSANSSAILVAGESGWSYQGGGPLSTESPGGSGFSTIGGSGGFFGGGAAADDLARARLAATIRGVEEDKWTTMTGTGRQDGMIVDDPSNQNFPPVIPRRPLPNLELNASGSPLLKTKILSFSRFRTAGLRRSVRQGSHERFVTPQRLVTLLQGTRAIGPLKLPASEDEQVFVEEDEEKSVGRLEGVGFTEFMDSALSRDVLEELLFRGGYLAEYEEDDVDFEHPSTHPSTSDNAAEPAEEVFVARQLQSSASRSRSPVPLIPEDSDENEEEPEATEDEQEGLGESEEPVPERPRGRRPAHLRLERRASGSAFRIPTAKATKGEREESEERGRARPRLNRSLLPPSSLSSRASSVPSAMFLSPARPRSLSIGAPSIHERASSVPAANFEPPIEVPKRIVRILEGSVKVRGIRALDLCGCVSGAFIAQLGDFISSYQLGPHGLFASQTSNITAIQELDDSQEELATPPDDSQGQVETPHPKPSRQLRRIFFPHMRRLGLASAFIPSAHLTAFVLSFPFLTHLDLTSTFAAPALLFALASAGKTGLGGRKMKLQALSLARCRLLTGAAIVGLFCGDCPPFTTMAGYQTGDDPHDESWGNGEIVANLVDLSLYGDSTSPSPLSGPELRLILTNSPAFRSNFLRSLDLSSTPLTDDFLSEHFPAQPQLIELGLAHCRGISVGAVATLLLEKCPAVEVLDLSHSCPAPLVRLVSAQRRATGVATISVMQLHTVLLGKVAHIAPSSYDAVEAEAIVKARKTNLRVVELDEKALDAVQGGAGDWKVVWGKGRRGWYVDIGVASRRATVPDAPRPRELYHLPRETVTTTNSDNAVRAAFDSPSTNSPNSAVTGIFDQPSLTSPQDFTPLAHRIIFRSHFIVERICSDRPAPRNVEEAEAAFLGMVKDLDRLSDLLCSVIDLCEVVRNVHTEEDWREGANEAYGVLCDYMNELNTHVGLYENLKSLTRLLPPDTPAKSPALFAAYAVAVPFLRDFEKSGIHLPDAQRTKFVDLSSSVIHLGRKFMQNITDPRETVSVTAEEVGKGLGEGFARRLFSNSKRIELDPTGWEARTLGRQHPNADLRKKMYLAGNSAPASHVEVLEELLRTRGQLAQLVERETWGDVALEDKLAQSPRNVMGFLSALNAHNLPRAKKDLQRLEVLKRERVGGSGKIEPWDRDYYTDVAGESTSPLPDISPFFSVGTCFQGLSRLFTALYGIRFEVEDVKPGEVWEAGVKRLRVVDEDEGVIGTIYCDLFDRAGKAPGAAHYTVRCARRLDDDDAEADFPDGTPRYEGVEVDRADLEGLKVDSVEYRGRPGRHQSPIIVLVCAFGNSATGLSLPAFLQWHEVETLFHEMGHAIHSMIGRTDYHNVAGTRCATDFVEMPSILMEHFVASPSVVSLFSSHPSTGRPLPTSILTSLLNERRQFSALETSTQISMAALDQAYHSSLPLESHFSSTDTLRTIQRDFNVIPHAEGVAWQAQFGHLFGYGATYYSYLFDRAIAAHIFSTKFASEPLSRERGEEFKKSVLRWGGGKEPWGMIGELVGSEVIAKGDQGAMEEVGRWGIEAAERGA